MSQREFWRNSEPERLPDQWQVMEANDDHTMTAVCEVWAVELGWDLRLMIDGHGLLLATVEGSVPRMLARVEKWRATMLAKGWS